MSDTTTLPDEIEEAIDTFRLACRADARLSAMAIPSNGAEAETRAALVSAISRALSDREERGRRAREALRLAEAFLAEEEWSGWRSRDIANDFIGEAHCETCGGFKSDGHAACALNTALSAARAVLAESDESEASHGR